MAQYASKRSHPMLVGIIIGMVIGFAVSAATALFITKAPIPFVEKVQHLAKPVDASALDGVDPNQKLYAKDTQGTPVNEPQSAVATVEAPTENRQAEDATQHVPGSYTIQAGAFRSQKDAERIRTDLAFIALEADVVKSSDAGVTLYRVILGPFDTAKEANELQQRLTNNGFAAMVVKH
ncbi:MAG: SPOR domain-containing protein [Burkholderiaceae bacterium]|nr:SPOR domain-containing protein [Burkholderiaceae bacterium]